MKRTLEDLIDETNQNYKKYNKDYVLRPSSTITDGSGYAFDLNPVGKMIKIKDLPNNEQFEYVGRISVPKEYSLIDENCPYDILTCLYNEFRKKLGNNATISDLTYLSRKRGDDIEVRIHVVGAL